MKTRYAPAAILLAAGCGSRFGSNKLLYPLGGKPMYRHIYDRLLLMQREGRISTLLVVTSHPEVAEAVRPETPVIWNDRPDLGIARSLHLGLTALREQHPDLEACLFAVGDQPGLSAGTLREFLQSYQNTAKGIAACSSCGTAGNPVLFAAEYFPELLALTGDRGGKRVMLCHPEDTFLFEVSPEQLRDIDTREDASAAVCPHDAVLSSDSGITSDSGIASDTGMDSYSGVRFCHPGSAKILPAEEAFPFLSRPRFVVSLCGAGGKSSLMYYLAGWCAAGGRRTLVTTTTHIGRPDSSLMADSPDDMNRLWRGGRLAVFGADDERAPGRKLKFPGQTALQSAIRLAECTFIEADGSRRLPAKVPGDHEPVLMPETDAVIGVLGLSAIGRPLREICFRAELAVSLFRASGIEADLDSCLTPEMAAVILSSNQGGRKGAEGLPYYIVLNQCDDAARRQSAEDICQHIAPGTCVGMILSHLQQNPERGLDNQTAAMR